LDKGHSDYSGQENFLYVLHEMAHIIPDKWDRKVAQKSSLFNKNEEDPYCSVKKIQEKDVKTRICINLVFSEILHLDQTQEAGGEGEEQGDQPGHCVWGQAEEGGAGDQVGDVDQVHEEDHLFTPEK